MAVHFHQSSQFEDARSHIEQHLYESVLEIHQNADAAIKSVEQFAQSIEHLFDVLEQMYQTPRPSDAIGEKSFPIREGRYRVFFKVVPKADGDFDIFMLDIDDNKQSNIDRFPTHRLISFDTDEN